MFAGFLPPATRCLAFDIPAAQASSWYFAFQEQSDYARFHSGKLTTAPPSGSAYYPVQEGWTSAADAAAAAYEPPYQVIIPAQSCSEQAHDGLGPRHREAYLAVDATIGLGAAATLRTQTWAAAAQAAQARIRVPKILLSKERR